MGDLARILVAFSNRLGSHAERSEAWTGKGPRLAHSAHRGYHCQDIKDRSLGLASND